MSVRDVKDIVSEKTHFFALDGRPAAGCQVWRVAWEQWGPKYALKRGLRGRQSLLYVVKGGITLRRGRKVLSGGPGSLAAFGPGSEHFIGVDPENPPEIFQITYAEAEGAPQTMANLGGQFGVWQPDNPHEIEALFRQIFDQAEIGRPLAQELCNSLIPVLLLSIRQGCISSTDKVSSREHVFLLCKSWLDLHARDVGSASEAADAHDISHAHLCRIFREYGEISPHAYLLRLKMARAEHELLSTDDPLLDIAESLGFSDAYSFSKAFKRVVGLSPSAYRKQAR